MTKSLLNHEIWKICFAVQCSINLRRFLKYIYIYIHSQRFIWNLKMMVSKRNLLSQGLIVRFHVKLQGRIHIYIYIHVPSILSHAKGPMKIGIYQKKNIATSPRGHNCNNFPSDGEVHCPGQCMMVMVECPKVLCVIRWGGCKPPRLW